MRNKIFWLLITLVSGLLLYGLVTSQTTEHHKITELESKNTSAKTSVEYDPSAEIAFNHPQSTINPVINASAFSLTNGWKLTGELNHHLSQLYLASEQGDKQASYLLAKNLQFCLRAPSDQSSYQLAIERGQEQEFDDRYFIELSQRYQYCQGISQNDRYRFVDYYRKAAEQGSVDAMVDYGGNYIEVLVQAHQSADTEKLSRQDILSIQQEYLTTAAQYGRIDALAKLSDGLWQQKFGHNDGVIALAYTDLLLNLTQDNELYNRHQWFKQRMLKQLSDDQIQQAQQLTEELSRKIQTHPNG
ncbi:hypothetical protein J7384_16190 [Endozoicomonas sp. G2_1]|uniref:hypothetical protein n=1 Tax=Endozoicomonas sp. G2_1 TaxID=2821091 RepID=UPI001ADCB520|nr:hypothetical protein [Endozoicomonas sp. G2_1]MBO9491901.1 hypothetical protein [Endozoicomonas sp. G2_1]